MLIDSHCHLDMLNLDAYQGDLSKAIQAAREADVGYLLSVGVTLKQSAALPNLVKPYNNVKISIGMHPGEELGVEVSVCDLIKLASNDLVVAFGETGLDYHYLEDDSLKSGMQERFRVHITAARQLKKPLIIHAREASHDLLTILKEEKGSEVGGVFHCFGDNWDVAKQALDLGYYLGITGIVTFKQADILREVVKKAPFDRILIETDSPYLAPEPYRGKPNEPKYLLYVAKKVAELKGLSYEQIAEITSQNFAQLFKVEIAL